MESTDEGIGYRRGIAGHETVNNQKQIPRETMLEVLLWLERFHLDATHISARCLRSLVENKQMPLRKVHRVTYTGDWRGYSGPPEKVNTLSIRLQENGEDGPAQVELSIEADTDALKAASYLSSCFVNDLYVYGHHGALPRNVIITAPALIAWLCFRDCNFDKGERDALGETLDTSTFQSLALTYSTNPAWQISDELLESLRLRGCNDVHIFPDSMEPADDDKFEVTEEGILDYCFTLDDGLPVPDGRSLRIAWANITPVFFKKVVEASKNSQLMCDVEICIEHLRFDVSNLDLDVLPSRSCEYDRISGEHIPHVRYDIANHGNGIRLLILFKSMYGERWDVTVRHGKKDREDFFEPSEDMPEHNAEFWKHEPKLENYDCLEIY